MSIEKIFEFKPRRPRIPIKFNPGLIEAVYLVGVGDDIVQSIDISNRNVHITEVKPPELFKPVPYLKSTDLLETRQNFPIMQTQTTVKKVLQPSHTKKRIKPSEKPNPPLNRT